MTENLEYASVDPEIYEDGGFYDHPDIYKQIRAIEPKAIGITAVTKLYQSTRRILSSDPKVTFSSDSTASKIFNIQSKIDKTYNKIPSSVLVCIEEAIVTDRSIHIRHNNDYLAVYETHRSCDRRFLTHSNPRINQRDLPDNYLYLLLTSTGTFNWGHWLIDDLTKIKAIGSCAESGGRKVCILLHGIVPSTNRARAESLKQIVDPSLRIKVKFLRPDSAYRVRKLYYPSPATYHPFLKHPDAVRELANAGRTMIARPKRWIWRSTKKYGAHLFVNRRPSQGRIPLNWQELHDLAIANGFVVFDPQDASFIDQVAAFSRAEKVIGMAGAAMSNTVFCESGARVLHFSPDSFLDPFYQDLAATCGHHYAACYGVATDGTRSAKSNYILDPDLLRQSIDWIFRS